MHRRRFAQLLALAPWARAATAGAQGPRHRVAMLGVAHAHAAGKLAALRALPERFEVVGVAEADPALRAAAQRSRSYDGLAWRTAAEWLADPTVAAVAVTSRTCSAASAAAPA